MNTERLISSAALAAVVAAAVGAIALRNEPETTLLMVSAVITGLLCFDTSMERNLHSRAPWLLVSLAPVLKTIPIVWYELNAENGLLVERYEHFGSLLFGLCLLGAVLLLARPAVEVGTDRSRFAVAVIAGSAASAAAAGASVAFLFDRDFGTTTAGRLIETPTWFVIGGLLAAVTIAASQYNAPSLPLMGLLSTAGSSAGLLAFTVAGRNVDRGWWAVLFAGLAISATGLGPGALGVRADRNRLSVAGVAVAIVAGVIAAASAISARSDPTAWAPGWIVLFGLSLAMFALAMASKPLDAQTLRTDAPDPVNDITHDSEQGILTAPIAAVPKPWPSPAAVAPAKTHSAFSNRLGAADDQDEDEEPAAPHDLARQVQAPAEPAVEPDQISTAEATAPAHDEPAPGAAPVPNRPHVATPAQTPTAQATTPAELSDSTLVAAAKAAATVREAPVAQRHSMAPVAQAHHFDPSTGLLSAAGLQHGLATAFATHRHRGHVTIMMFTVRDLDEIEARYGRLASAAVTREVAERVRTLLPGGSGARFGRSAYAVIFVGDLGDPNATIQQLAQVLLHLRAPVEEGALGDQIDVVASMAQCYEGEDAGSFVKRANLGLARAVQTVEPTFVAMP